MILAAALERAGEDCVLKNSMTFALTAARGLRAA